MERQQGSNPLSDRPAPGINERRDSGIFPQSNFIGRGVRRCANAPAKSFSRCFPQISSAPSSRLRYSPFLQIA